MSCSWLFAGSHSFTSFLSFSELYLLHWLDLQKGQNSPLKWSRAVKSSCAHHYVCGPWMALHYPCEKRLVVLFKLLRYEQGLNKLPRTHWCMVGTHKASTCARECLITRCSLRPNHPQICGAWIAPAWWPIVVSANQGNTSSIIQFCS